MTTESANGTAVPIELTPFYDDWAKDVHQFWHNRDLRDVRSTMPELQHAEVLDGKTVPYVDLQPPVDQDESNVTALLLPYAQGWKPSMYIRAEFGRQIVTPGHRFIVLPNNTVGQKHYSFETEELEQLSNGNFEPVADRQAALLEQLGVTSLRVFGYSQGSSVGSELVRKVSGSVNVTHAGLAESPNVQARDKKPLRNDFSGKGPAEQLKTIGDQIRAVKAVDIRGLNQVLGGTVLGKVRMLQDYAAFGISAARDPGNKAIGQGFEKDTFEASVLRMAEASPETALTLINMANSRICVTGLLAAINQRLVAAGHDSRHLTVSGYGHDGAENSLVHALSMRAAFGR